MSRGIIAITLTILLVFFSSVYSEEEIRKEGLSPAELEAILQHNEGTELMLSGRYKEAILCFRKALGLNPDFTGTYYNLGISYEKLGKHRDSIEALKEAIQLDPNQANAHYALGYAYYQLKEYDEAVAAFKQSMKIKPDNAFAHSKLGHIYILLGNKEAAKKHYEILKTLDNTLANELYSEINKGKK